MVLKIFWQIFLIAITLGFLFVYLRYIENRSLFYPQKEIDYYPKDIGLDFENVYFQSQDGLKLSGWFIPANNARYTVIFTHGNAGNISHRVEKLKFFNSLGCNVFIFDYRGYGRSQGRPSEKGLYIDTKSAYDYLLSRTIIPEKLIGYGESLGGTFIIALALRNKMRALIVDSAFTSAADMVKHLYHFLPAWFFASRLDSLSKIKLINIPKLIIHSLNDEIVPYKLGQKLYNAAGQPKEFLQIHGGHNSCFFESESILREKIADFLKRISG